jgi:hypothetical protein
VVATGGASILIRRQLQINWAAYAAKVSVDGRDKASLRIGQKAQIDVPAGVHVVRVSIFRTWSSLEVTVGPNDTVRLVFYRNLAARAVLALEDQAIIDK